MRSSLARVLAVGALASVALATVRTAGAQVPSGSTLSPDLQSYMVNKDLGTERWTINLNLFSSDPTDIISATGNIFDSSGGPASFVTCLVRADSTGSLADPDSTFLFSCSGANACTSTAQSCAQDSWTLISDNVAVPATFFLPPGGLGALPQTVSRADGAHSSVRSALARAGWSPQRVPASPAASVLTRLVAFVGDTFDGFERWLVRRRGMDLSWPQVANAENTVKGVNSRGATLTLDQFDFLVTKDVGDERWSISYSYQPVVSAEGGVVNQFLSVTGNVYQPDGSPPSFVFCTLNPDSTGTLEDPSSEFNFSCSGTNACETTAAECAETSWTLISNDISLQASFFLPPGGLPATVQSDPEIVIIGRTSDPPSIIAPEFSMAAGTSAADRPAGECPVGATCFVAMLGDCEDVEGEVTETEGSGCGCLVQEVPSGCITCGSGASGQCGGACEYEVAGFTARGTCLPFDYESEQCSCYAIGAGEQQTIQGCGGVLDVACSASQCCANDPRGACDQLGSDVSCPGICVDGTGCP